MLPALAMMLFEVVSGSWCNGHFAGSATSHLEPQISTSSCAASSFTASPGSRRLRSLPWASASPPFLLTAGFQSPVSRASSPERTLEIGAEAINLALGGGASIA